MFPMTYELKTLGWQVEEGFFAFANTTYRPADVADEVGTMNKYNDYGVVEVNEKHYLSPSNSKANDLVRSEDNLYENDLYLTFKESKLNFKAWSELMVEVYGKNAWFGIAFAVATLFRDLIIKTTKIAHLYPYGGVGAGKSEFMESINNLFFSGLDSAGELYKPFNLNQGTEYAFWNRMERYNNCPNALNEFDENSIDDIRFRAIKSAYDGEGRSKGLKDRNRATMQKVNCTLIIAGQYLGTKDDNAVLMRSYPLAFKPAPNRPESQMQAFKRLKDAERSGLSGILIELLDLRPHFKKYFADDFALMHKAMGEQLRDEGMQTPTRILKNICCLVSVINLVSKKVQLPFTVDEFFNHSKDFTRSMTNLIASTSGVSDFWSTVEFLLERGMIREHFDFIVITEDAITINDPDSKNPLTKHFTPAKTLLLLRLSGVHKLYQQSHRTNTGKTALNEQTLLLYMKDQPYYVGWKKSQRFKNAVNSCYVFDYEPLGINLVRDRESEVGVTIQLVAEVATAVERTPNDGIYKFSLKEYRNAVKDGANVTQTEFYQCFTRDFDAFTKILKGYKIQVKGTLTTAGGPERVFKTIDVMHYEACSPSDTFKMNLDGEQPVQVVQQEMSFEEIKKDLASN